MNALYQRTYARTAASVRETSLFHSYPRQDGTLSTYRDVGNCNYRSLTAIPIAQDTDRTVEFIRQG
jgi:hypothetical protein